MRRQIFFVILKTVPSLKASIKRTDVILCGNISFLSVETEW